MKNFSNYWQRGDLQENFAQNKGEERQKEILKRTVFFVPHSHRTFFSRLAKLKSQCVISLRKLYPAFFFRQSRWDYLINVPTY